MHEDFCEMIVKEVKKGSEFCGVDVRASYIKHPSHFQVGMTVPHLEGNLSAGVSIPMADYIDHPKETIDKVVARLDKQAKVEYRRRNKTETGQIIIGRIASDGY